MAAHGTTTLAPPAAGNGARQTPAARPVSRRRGLPGSRAVVGGLLVAASAVGVFAAYGSANAGPTDQYVVVTADVSPGERLTSGHLELVSIDLPGGQRSVAFTEPDLLVGAVATSRMVSGQLVQQSDVAKQVGVGELAQISVPVEPGSAMNGSRDFLREDERVDVIVTHTQGGTPVTITVAQDALVVKVMTGDRELGTSGQLTVVLAVPPDELEAIAGAAATGRITLARTTGLDR